MQPFHLIVAMDAKQGIGKDGSLPWHLPADLRHFKTITSKAEEGKRNVVVMGRKTWESLPEKFKPLPDRLNVILTRNIHFQAPKGVKVIHDLADFDRTTAEQSDLGQIFIIGGAEIFQLALQSSACSTLYMTHIKGDFHCDTFFPSFKPPFQLTHQTEQQREGEITFSFARYDVA